MSQRQRDQIEAVNVMISAFSSKCTPAESAYAMFPSRVHEDNTQDATEVNNFLAKINSNPKVQRAVYRNINAEVHKARNSELQKPDAMLKLLFRCRKHHVFYNDTKPTAIENQNFSGTNIPVLSNGAPPSPFLRRTASRDPIHKVKEEVQTPLSPVNGPTSHQRSRSQSRSHSMLTGQGLPPPIKMSLSTQSSPYNQHQNSIEKTSAANPLYFNVGTPLRPGIRTKEEPLSAQSTPLIKKSNPPPYPGKPLYARMGTPPSMLSIQSSHLSDTNLKSVPMEPFVRELRGAIQGISGMYFTCDGRGHLVISKSCSISDSIQSAVQDLLHLGNTFIELKRKVSRGSDQNITKGALIEAVQRILDKYITDVGAIRVHNEKYGVQLLVARTFPWVLRLDSMKRCLSVIDQPSLFLQEEIYDLWLVSRGTESENVMDIVLEATLGVFCNTLRAWINSGELVNDRWIIQEYTSDIGFKVEYKPTFVSGIALENILKIGMSQSLVTGGDLDKLEHFRELVETHVTPKNLATIDGRARMNRMFTDMADWIGRKVVDQLLGEGHLMEYLSAARKFLLLDDAAFSLALHKCIQKMSTDLGLTRDEALMAFVTAIKKSPAAQEYPFRVIIDTLVSPSSTPIGSARTQFIQSIHPLMRVTGLAEKVFKNTQSGYETLFHFLWSIQTALYTIQGVADRLRQIYKEASINKDFRQVHRKISSVCTRFLRIFLAIRHYTIITISQLTGRFHARLGDANDVESAAEQHLLFLEDLQSTLFCGQEDTDISSIIDTLVQKAYQLSKRSMDFEKELTCHEQSVPQDASESMIEFARVEQLAGLTPIKAEIMAMDRSVKEVILTLHKRLSDMKDRSPLVAIILYTK